MKNQIKISYEGQIITSYINRAGQTRYSVGQKVFKNLRTAYAYITNN